MNKDNKKNVAVVFGGASVEHDVSIITGLQTAKAIEKEYNVLRIYLTTENEFYLSKFNSASEYIDKAFLTKKCKKVTFYNKSIYQKKWYGFKRVKGIDCVLNCCHGGDGEGGAINSFFGYYNIPCTSANTLASAVCLDKYITKLIAKDNGVNVIPFEIVTANSLKYKIPEINKNLGRTLIVKPNSLGSSIGVIKCEKNALKSSVETCLKLDDKVLVENCIENMEEYNCACLKDGSKLLLGKIEKSADKNSVLSYEDKYYGNVQRNVNEGDKKLNTRIYEYTKKLYNIFDLTGVVRMDYIYDKENDVLYLNEINTIPGSLAYYLYTDLGIDTISLVKVLIDNAKTPKLQPYFESDILLQYKDKHK